MNDDNRYAEEDPNAPLTRGEFNDAMTMIANAFNGMATSMATKSEVNQLRSEMHSMEKRLGGKIDDLFQHIDTAVEARQVDLGAAKSEAVELHGERLDRHNERIEVLERQAGLQAD